MYTKGHTVAILVRAGKEIPLVRDPKKPEPIYWKLPGGRGNPGEIPEDTAIRELHEELGLKIPKGDLKKLFEEDRESHDFILFAAEVASLKGMKERGDEDEEIKVFFLEKLAELPDLFLNHKAILRRLKIIS